MRGGSGLAMCVAGRYVLPSPLRLASPQVRPATLHDDRRLCTMSKTLEKQIEDAERAETVPPEPEPDDDETTDDDETGEPDDDDEEGHEAEQEEAQAVVESDDPGMSMEAQRSGLEREATRHYKALEKLMPGFEHDFSECPTCMSFGYVPDPPPKVSEVHERCPACNGRGGVITPSLVEGHQIEQCMRCRGNGWIDKVPVAPAPTVYVDTTNGTTATLPAVEDPMVAALRAKGYIVTPTTPPAAPGA